MVEKGAAAARTLHGPAVAVREALNRQDLSTTREEGPISDLPVAEVVDGTEEGLALILAYQARARIAIKKLLT